MLITAAQLPTSWVVLAQGSPTSWECQEEQSPNRAQRGRSHGSGAEAVPLTPLSSVGWPLSPPRDLLGPKH